MKILKQLSKFFLFTFLLINPVSANEPVDIWNIEKKDTEENEILIENTNDDENKIIQGIKIEQQNEKILVNNALGASEIKLAGLYDPEENGLSIDMWSNSNGEDIKYVLDNITTKELSKFSEKVLEIALLTNSYIPNNNISPKEFLDFKFNYLKKKKDFNLIKEFLIKNPNLRESDDLITFYVDHFLSNSQLDKSCEIFEIVNSISEDYLTNFKMYCLIDQERRDEAQLLFDLKSELGSVDKFFSDKFNILMGYKKPNDQLSEKNILYFHISHKTIETFEYDPKIETPKFIWNYLSTSNLLKNSDLVDIESSDQIKLIETATNDGVYEEEELLNLYKRFRFDINQLLNFNDAYKLLNDYEARALLYQRFLLSDETTQKLTILSKLKELFDEAELSSAFDNELAKALKSIPYDDVPSNFTSFYKKNREPEKVAELKIKFNNKVFHQSKLLNYFQNKTSLPQVEKETNDLLKKIKKNKKYFFSIKDIIMAESLKSDGVQILKKYDGLYEYETNIPSDINSMIVNGETGLVLLKIAQIIGEDDLEDLDLDSVNFVIGIMNELKIVNLRNEILLKVLPLKV
jgi:hypothetical protein|tara:strand:- start:359 stop:2089 length:1731 start_codon:yes stop_codon:yes gene_type:complete